MSTFVDTEIRDEIFEAVTEFFGFNIHEYVQIYLGFKNLKWQLKTDAEDLFVKQYNNTRYPKARLPELEAALQLQAALFKKGIPCPQLFSHEGKYVLETKNGEHFVLMGFNEGSNIRPGHANPEQMHSLGMTIGKMHSLLERNTGRQPLYWDVLSKEELLENWSERWNEAMALDCGTTLSRLEVQRRILEENHPDLFSQCEEGWTHWDLFADNILFKDNRVSAILDFDRMTYVYPEFDISRPILSCCINENRLHLECVSAFVSGYREFKPLSPDKLVRSIKLTWWREGEWVRVEKPGDSSPLKRFREENVWIGENWDHLKDLLSGL